MRFMSRRGLQLGAGLAALAIAGAACSSTKSSSSSNTTGQSASTIPNQIYADASNGTPQPGGTLTVLGTSDVDNALDPNVGYYTLDYLASEMYSRSIVTQPSVRGQTFTDVPDLATTAPTATDNGLKYAVTIRSGVMWNSTPPRQVTAADVVRGVKRSCNPTLPFAGQADYSDVLAGYTDFCNGFAKVSATSASAQAAYINGNNISGVTVDPANPQTVDFTLTKPASYFPGVLSLPPFNPAPVEFLNYLPGSNDLAQHLLSDGPYEVQSYSANKSIVFVRNPAWQASSDPVRKAYVDKIEISETGNQQGIYQQILTNSPSADMLWDIGIPPSAIPGLIASKDPRFSLQTEGATNPYIVFNTISKDNNGALANPVVRQAISYALSRDQLVQNHSGPQVAVPQTHLIAPGTEGSSPSFDDYPFNVDKAKQLLAQAGASNLNLKYLYRSQNISAQKDFETVQANMQAVGITITGVPTSNADFYGKYLTPGTAAKNSAWDLAEAGWGPDWYPNGGKSWFLPLLNSANLPPNSSNFGFFSDPKLDSLMSQALDAPTEAAATDLWHQADVEAMAQAAIYPIAAPNEAAIHGARVQNCVFIAQLQNCNFTNVWLKS